VKIHGVDLLEILPALAAWDALSPAARLAWVQADGNRTTEPGAYGEDEDRMLEAGLLVPTARGLQRVGRTARDLRTVLRAAERCAVLTSDADVSDALQDYVQDTYTQAERGALLADPSYYGWDVTRELPRRAASRRWVQDLLASRPAAWERPRRTGPRGGDLGWSRLLTPTVHAELDRIVRDVAEAGGAVPLGVLLEGSDRRRRSTRAKAAQAALRYLVLFPRLAPGEPRLEVGLVPAVAAALAGSKVEGPRAADVELDAAPPFWIDDMMAVLLDAASGEARIKASGRELYQKTLERMRSVLSPLSPLVERWAQTNDQFRVEAALSGLKLLDLVRIEKGAGGRGLLVPSPAGQAWLAASLEERITAFGRLIRGEDTWEEPDDWWSAHPMTRALAPYVSQHETALSGISDAALAEALRAALGALPSSGANRLGAWLHHQARAKNPLLGTGPAGHAFRPVQRHGVWVSPEEYERVWFELLSSATALRLIPLGGIALKEGEKEPLAGLTSIGRYLIRQADAFDLPGAGAAPARIVVQASFDVVFLGPAPDREALLAPFADRVGHGVGTLFRLSRDAATRAAAAGMTGEEALERLQSVSTDALPENVARSLQDWFGRVRTVDAAHVLVLTCPDEETASRVATAGGKLATRLGPTAVAVTGAPALGRMRKRLEREGILLGQPTGEVPRKKARKARRRSYRRRC
jgi:hypothetical protein